MLGTSAECNRHIHIYLDFMYRYRCLYSYGAIPFVQSYIYIYSCIHVQLAPVLPCPSLYTYKYLYKIKYICSTHAKRAWRMISLNNRVCVSGAYLHPGAIKLMKKKCKK